MINKISSHSVKISSVTALILILKIVLKVLGCNSVVENLPSKHEALGSIVSATEKKKKKTRRLSPVN